MLKPKQDIYTSFLLVAFILIIVLAVVQALTILERSGIIRSGTFVTSMQTDNLNLSAANIMATENTDNDGCEIIYHQASRGSEYAVGSNPYARTSSSAVFLDSRRATVISSETQEDDMGSLFYAVYICTGISLIADGYI